MKITKRLSSGLTDWDIRVTHSVEVEWLGPAALNTSDKTMIAAVQSRIESMIGSAIKETLDELGDGSTR